MAELYKTLKAELGRYLTGIQHDAEDVLSFPASEFERLTRTLGSQLKSGGVCTMVVDGRTNWDPRGQYYRAIRAAAKRGLSIWRYFLLPQYQCIHHACLREQVKLDTDAGINVELLYIGDLLSHSTIPRVDSLDFGIWDAGEIVCTMAYASGDRAELGHAFWRVSKRQPDIELYNEVIEILKASAPKLNLDQKLELLDLEEPMLISAPLARMLSMALCKGNHVARDDCSWYHGVWQYLRLFDLVSTPTWHKQFYQSALTKAFDTLVGKQGRVLITGTADYSVFAYVLWCGGKLGEDLQVDIIDLCETPLVLCRWYHRFVEHKSKLNTLEENLFALSPESSYDIISTDAFLTRFDALDQPKIVGAWAKLLKAGGLLVTTVRIDPSISKEGLRASPSEVSSFRGRCLEEAVKWRGFLDLPPEQLATMAQSYADRMTSYSLLNVQALRQLIDPYFEVMVWEIATVQGEMHQSEYVRIVAKRR